MAEKMKISHHYDQEADILYIDFGSDEPCFTEDLDGVVMVDIGWFSKLPRGLRIISPKARKVEVNFKMVVQLAENKCKDLMEQQAQLIHTQEPVLQTLLGRELNQAFAYVN